MARILVVDDDRDILVIVRALLETDGHEVAVSESALNAVEQAKTSDFDLIITDANMTPHSGYDLIRTIRMLRRYEFVPIAMLTARKTRKDVERALLLGAKDYIVKPIDPEALIKKTRELLAKGEAARLASRFAELEIKDDAVVSLNLTIIGLTETSVRFDSDHPLREGTPLKVNSPLFERIGIGPQLLKVQVSGPLDPEFPSDAAWDVRAGFTQLDEKSRLKLRNFLTTQFNRTGQSTAKRVS